MVGKGDLAKKIKMLKVAEQILWQIQKLGERWANAEMHTNKRPFSADGMAAALIVNFKVSVQVFIPQWETHSGQNFSKFSLACCFLKA